ncbi:MAG: phosphotransferase, partial [Desulfobacterales bacterium]
VSPDGYVEKFETRGQGLESCRHAKLAFTGIQVLDPEILDFIPSSGYSSSIDAFTEMIGAGRRIKAFICANHYWRDIGTPRDYRRAVYDKLAPQAFLRAWPKLRPHPIDRVKLRGDGSDRKWYRLTASQKSLVMVDHGIRKGPETAAVDSFVAIGRHLSAAGLPVPKIYLDDSFAGLVFMEDLGDKNLQDVIQKTKYSKDIVHRYRSIIRLLLKQSVTGAKNFNPLWAYQTPTYDRELILEKECRYFVEAFLKQYLGWDITGSDLEDEFTALAKKTVELSINGFMHRDFQSRNIMVQHNQYYFIDFQGGRIGPVQYDLASLIIDPYVALPLKMQKTLLDYCVRILPSFGIAEPAKFQSGYYYCALTRNLQILGAFGYLSKTKKKKYFAKYIPCAVAALKNNLGCMPGNNFPKLAKIAQHLVDKPEAVSKMTDRLYF